MQIPTQSRPVMAWEIDTSPVHSISAFQNGSFSEKELNDREGAPKLARPKGNSSKSGGGGSIWDPSANTFPFPSGQPCGRVFLGQGYLDYPALQSLVSPPLSIKNISHSPSPPCLSKRLASQSLRSKNPAIQN